MKVKVQTLDGKAAKGADKAGSSATMNLNAHLEPGKGGADCVLVGSAVVSVSGKLAQFGSRLLVPVSDAMMGQFADNFRAAAAAVPAAPASGAKVAPGTPDAAPLTPAALAAARELNALALARTVIKAWFAGLFGNTVEWGGRRLTLHPDGRIRD